MGDRVAVVITLKNTGWLPVAWVLVEDLLPRRALMYQPPSLQVEGQRTQLAMLGGRGKHTMFYQLQCNRRGYHQIGPLVVETGDLFGLHRRYRVLTSPHFLLVYPTVVPLEGFELASRRPIGEVRISHRLYEDPTRIAGVRRYEAGDPLNRIHWRATARTGQFHSKIFEPSCIVGATLLLGFPPGRLRPAPRALPLRTCRHGRRLVGQCRVRNGPADRAGNQRPRRRRPHPPGRDSPHLPERPFGCFAQMGTVPLRKAARRAAGMLEQSDRLRPVIVETRRGPEQLLRILETLARVELTDGLSFAQLVAETASRLPRDATVVALLASPSIETAVALGELRRKGLAVTAILNLYDDTEFERASAHLAAEGIEARHLKSVEIAAQRVPGVRIAMRACRQSGPLSRRERVRVRAISRGRRFAVQANRSNAINAGPSPNGRGDRTARSPVSIRSVVRMARRLHKTLVDYLVIAISPALIIAMVGSLVFFLFEVFYQGNFHGRLQYIFALFVIGTVLIGRISIEEGRERAALFAIATCHRHPAGHQQVRRVPRGQLGIA